MQGPDLREFDLEYSNIFALSWQKQLGEIEMNLHCPVVNWCLKEKFVKIAEKFGFKTLLSDPCTEYLVNLKFLGVSEVTESMLTEGQQRGLSNDCRISWSEAISNFLVMDIEIINSVKLELNEFRFYLEAEGLLLHFNYKDCTLLQKCIS